jgi:predicted HAD superfamily hydrolase
LYLSSEIGLTKREGTLFEFVCQDLKIDRTKLIHIGDSWSSDFQIPKKLGISACHIPTFTPKSHFHLPQSGLSYRILNAFLDNTAPIQADDYYRFGYEKFGMFLNGYVQWLFRSLIQEEISEVWFFSRDGWIMKQAFDRLNEEENGKNEKNGKGKIHSHYLEVSRRSLRIPVLWMDASLSSVLDMVSPSALLPLRTIFDGVGLDIEQYQSLLTQYGFHTETVLDRKTALQNENLNRLYDELLEDILQNSKQEYTYLVKYLQQNQVEGRMAVVDIGWSGGMQRYLEECLTKLQIEHQIKGYYIGVADYYTRNTKVVPTLDLNGYLFDFQDEQRSSDKRRPFVGLFESLFLEQAGSVKNYSEQKGKIVANRMPYEYSENGKESFEAVCVKRIQEGALDFISQASKHPILNTLPFSADDLFSGLQKTGLHPNRKDLSLFADFRFFDEGETEYLAAPKGLFFYFFHLNQLKKDFLLSRWKIGFLKRLLKLPLPYEKIYNVLRGQLGRNGS